MALAYQAETDLIPVRPKSGSFEDVDTETVPY